MKTLVIAEHNNKQLKPTTLNCVTAELAIGDDVEVIALGYKYEKVIDDLKKIKGVSRVNFIENEDLEHQLAEDTTKQLMDFVQENTFSHILAPSSTFGKNLLPRIAALLDVQQISDVIKIIDHETFERPIYAGNAILKLKSNDKIKVITIRGTCFEQASMNGSCDAQEFKNSFKSENKVTFLKHELSKTDRPELTSAKAIVSGGRGMQNGENFKLLEGIADKLGAAMGASRAAVDAGFVPNDWQVGQTGKIVAPDLYIAVGISGAIQHIAGIKDSKYIVAINKDEEAPIFKFSDYGLVGDLFEVLPKLEEKL